MELWLILLLAALIFAICAIYGAIQVRCLFSLSAPSSAGITLIYMHVFWGLLTVVTVSFASSIWHWVGMTAFYLSCFMLVFHKAGAWARAIRNFLT